MWKKPGTTQNCVNIAEIENVAKRLLICNNRLRQSRERALRKLKKNMQNFVNLFAAWTSGRSGILDTISDMKEKAESTLSDARAAEMKAGHESSPLSGLEVQVIVFLKT